MRQQLPFSGTQDSRILAGSLQLTGSAAVELNNIAHDVDVLAGVISGPLALADVDDLTIGTTSAATGLTSGNRDVLLRIGSLHLQQSLDAGTADVRLRSLGDLTQSATAGIIADQLAVLQGSTTAGDIDLGGINDVNVTALSNQYSAGNITLNDIDDLIIDLVRSATSAGLSVPTLTGVTAVGGDITITARGDLTILQDVTSRDAVVDNTAVSGEHIVLQSIDGNILVDATARAIMISTDENPLTSNPVTGDSVSLLADSDATYDGDLDGDAILDQSDPDIDGDGILNAVDRTVDGVLEGQVTLLGDITLSTDGGVAKRFGPRPAVGEPSTAFFVYSTSPLPRAFDNNPAAWASGNAYINAFDVEVGVAGEQNLQVDVDWLDPVNEFLVVGDAQTQAIAAQLGLDNPMSSERIQQFLISNGGAVNTIGHLYTARDFTLFQVAQHRTTIPVDLSVAHHSSIGVRGSFIEQNSANQPVPGADAASTDNVLTGGATFEGGFAQFRIPTVTPAPPGLFVAAIQPRVDRPTVVAPPENRAVFDQSSITDFSGAAVGGSAFSTEVYFQIRRQFELDQPSEVVIERVTDGRLISSRDALEKFVRENPELQDGSGYEIWLVTETGGQKVERPIVEFEITGGKPGPATEEVPETLEPPRLKDVPFEQPEVEGVRVEE